MTSSLIDGILYCRIESEDTARVCNGENEIKHLSGKVEIKPKVLINDIACIVIEISNHAFFNSTKITEISIPSTVKTLKSYCFSHLFALKIASHTIKCY